MTRSASGHGRTAQAKRKACAVRRMPWRDFGGDAAGRSEPRGGVGLEQILHQTGRSGLDFFVCFVGSICDGGTDLLNKVGANTG